MLLPVRCRQWCWRGAGPLGGDRPAADYALPAGGAAAGDGRVRLAENRSADALLLGTPALGFLAAPGVLLAGRLRRERRPAGRWCCRWVSRC